MYLSALISYPNINMNVNVSALIFDQLLKIKCSLKFTFNYYIYICVCRVLRAMRKSVKMKRRIIHCGVCGSRCDPYLYICAAGLLKDLHKIDFALNLYLWVLFFFAIYIWILFYIICHSYDKYMDAARIYF